MGLRWLVGGVEVGLEGVWSLPRKISFIAFICHPEKEKKKRYEKSTTLLQPSNDRTVGETVSPKD